METLIKKIIKRAKETGALINPTVLEAILFKTKGKCLCKINTECPCKESIEEVKKKGRCYCGLFIKPS